MHSQRGAMNLFKSLASSAPPTPPTEFENIEFDWGEQRRGELERRVKLLEQEYSEERRAVAHALSLNGETEETVPSRPGSWELTPEELTLRRHLEEEDARRFEIKNHIWINSSCVSAHPKDFVPYPLAYDKVDIQK